MTRFADAAVRLAGRMGARFGWLPDAFWAATPAEIAALALDGGDEGGAAALGDDLARMMEAFPDG